jgi:two-component system chemotaxis response regulator CheB
VVIGCSAGGLTSLQRLLGGLRRPLPVSVTAVCHSGSESMAMFCDLLQRHSPMPVSEAEERMKPVPGHVHIAPSGYHLLLERNGQYALSVDGRVEYSRPSIDVLFESAADLWQDRVLGLIMTGANADGAQGLEYLRKRGGLAVVEHPSTATVSTMPAAALERAGADYCLPLPELAPLLEFLCSR